MLALVRRLPRSFWLVLAVLVLLLGAVRWHETGLRRAERAGRVAQAALDRAAVLAAERDASARQAALVRAADVRAERISREVADGLQAELDDLGRRHAELRLRWARAAAADGGPGERGAAAAADAAAGADAAACAARGWVDFDSASALAEAADRATAKDDAWIAWMRQQQAAWPE